MTRVLILGGSGMLGHKLWQVLRDEFETWVTVRSSFAEFSDLGIFDESRVVARSSADDLDSVQRAFDQARPEVVVNAIGVIKQLPSAHDPVITITINALFPHRVARLCAAVGARLIQISTDCVFSGRKGLYTESDVPDSEDLYGRSKQLGEVVDNGNLTLRTSIIGRELNTSNGLVEWFLSNRGRRVDGFRKAIFSGLTTSELSRSIAMIIRDRPTLTGLYHVSSEPIDKCSLLELLREAYRVPVEIEPRDTPVIDRSLDSSRFRQMTGWTPLPWRESIRGMAADPTPYDRMRRGRGV